MMMDSIRSSETSVLTRATRRNIPENGILQRTEHFGKDLFRTSGDGTEKATLLRPLEKANLNHLLDSTLYGVWN
jgi:hypothetical protein